MLTIITPAVTGNLTVLATVKAELGITGSADDAYLEAMICQASQMLATFCGRRTFGLERVRQTERLNTSPEVIILDRDLNVGLVSVTEDGEALTAADYELDGSLLYRLDGAERVRWTAGTVVQITYDTGWQLLTDEAGVGLPHDLERACLEVIKAGYYARGRDPMLRSESVEGIGSSSYMDPRGGSHGLPPQASALAEPYRLHVI